MDRLQLMVQSPFRVFAYWEVTPERLQKALAPFPKEEQTAFRMILRWIEIGQGLHQAFDSGAASEWWFASPAGQPIPGRALPAFRRIWGDLGIRV